MAPTVAMTLALFASQIGTGEHPPGSNATKYGPREPWCYDFMSWGFKQLDALDLVHGWHAYVPDAKAIFQAHGQWHTSNPKPGDLAVFNWDGGLDDHIGIVEKVISSSTIQTIEGNTDNKVMRRLRNRGYVHGYCRPAYAAAHQEDDDMKLTDIVNHREWTVGECLQSGKQAEERVIELEAKVDQVLQLLQAQAK